MFIHKHHFELIFDIHLILERSTVVVILEISLPYIHVWCFFHMSAYVGKVNDHLESTSSFIRFSRSKASRKYFWTNLDFNHFYLPKFHLSF